MRNSYVLDSESAFSAEFARCCRDYKALSVAVAWCGSPSQTLPYGLLENFKGAITATVGVAFNHTHPDVFEWLDGIGADTRVFRDEAGLFHPKVYLFRDGHRYALFVGSSNFTYGGFYSNHEINCLIEGMSPEPQSDDISSLEDRLSQWRTDKWSFKPSKRWIDAYRERYREVIKKQRRQEGLTPPLYEEEFSTTSWLQHADWSTYYQKVIVGLRNHERSGQGYHDVLNAASEKLSLPWTSAYFGDIEKRRIMGGIKEYGWLGHVAASGQVRSLFANGSPGQKATIVKAVNAIAMLEHPVPLETLKANLLRLVRLGPTMKVWGRLLCLVRPDLYCTVSAPSVRKSLSQTLDLPQSKFDSVDGYVQLIGLIHSAPWFNAKEPSDKEQAAVWGRRAAFLDAIFY